MRMEEVETQGARMAIETKDTLSRQPGPSPTGVMRSWVGTEVQQARTEGRQDAQLHHIHWGLAGRRRHHRWLKGQSVCNWESVVDLTKAGNSEMGTERPCWAKGVIWATSVLGVEGSLRPSQPPWVLGKVPVKDPQEDYGHWA